MVDVQIDRSIDALLEGAINLAEDEPTYLQEDLSGIMQAYAAKDFSTFLQRTASLYQDLYQQDLEDTAETSNLVYIHSPLTSLVFNAYIKGALEMLNRHAHFSFEKVTRLHEDIKDYDTLFIINPGRNEIIKLPTSYSQQEDDFFIGYNEKPITSGDRISTNAHSMWLSKRLSAVRMGDDYRWVNNPLVDIQEIDEPVKVTPDFLRAGMVFKEVSLVPGSETEQKEKGIYPLKSDSNQHKTNG